MDWNDLLVNEEIPVFQLFPEFLQESLSYVVDVEETPLTKALRGGSFKEAEKIIKDNANNDILNQGPFTTTPLSLALSGHPDNRFVPCHLGLAKLLAECGADVNHRVPASHNKLSPSPMEYLIQLIFETKDAIHNDKETEEEDEDWSFLPLQTIGLNNETKLEGSLLIKQMFDLLDIFIEHGGNPSVRTTQNESTLYHMVLSDPEPDLELAMKLCEAESLPPQGSSNYRGTMSPSTSLSVPTPCHLYNCSKSIFNALGGNLNTPNRHLTTPLMDLILYADYDNALDILHNIWERNSDISSLNTVNANNESALWRAMHACSPQLAVELLHKGADSSSWASVLQEKWYYQTRIENFRVAEQYVQKNGVSPICAPLLQNSSAYRMYSSISVIDKHNDSFEFPKAFYVELANKVMAASVFPIVDNICQSSLFNSTTIHTLETQLDVLTCFNIESQIPSILRQEMPHLLFGNLKAGLQQLCVRQIVHQMFFNKNIDERKKLLKKLMDDGIELEKLKEEIIEEWDEGDADISSSPRNEDETNDIVNNIIRPTGDDWLLVKTITSEMITKMVSSYLNLPSALVPRFIIEIVRLQLAASLFLCERDCTLDDDSDSFEQYLLEDNNYDVDTHSLSNSNYEYSEDDDYDYWFGPDGPIERDFNWAKTVVPPPPFVPNGSISENSQEISPEADSEIGNSEKSSSIEKSATTEDSSASGVDGLNSLAYVELTCDPCASSSDTSPASNEEPDL